MDPYSLTPLPDHAPYYSKQAGFSTQGFSRGAPSIPATASSISVYASPVHMNNAPSPYYYRSIQSFGPTGYTEEDIYAGYHHRSSLGAGGDVCDFSPSGARFGMEQYEREAAAVDYWATSESPSTRPFSQTAYLGGPGRYQESQASNPRFKQSFGQSGNRSPGRGPRFGGAKPRRIGLTSPVGSDQNGSARRAPTQSFYCDLCKVSCAGPKAFADHESGHRHKKRLAQHEAIERLKQSTGGELLKTTVNSKVPELRCELCDVGCTGAEAYTAHLSGKLHQRAVRLHRELGKPVPETDNPLPSSAVAETVVPKVEDVKPKIQSTPSPVKPTSESKPSEVTPLKNVELSQFVGEEKKAVGAEFIQTIPGPNGKGIHYRCNLCECQFTNADAKELHLKGRRHHYQYKKKVDPDLFVPRKSSKPARKKAASRPEVFKEKPNILPPMPSSSSLTWVGVSPTMEGPSFFNMQSPFPRMPFRSQGPGPFVSPAAQPPNAVLDNRYLAAKHSSIVPTEMEAQAMKSAVSVCELTLKRISDSLCESSHRDAAGSAQPSEKKGDDSTPDVDKAQTNGTPEVAGKSPAEALFEEGRVLRGVVRVGSLGKSLLLRGHYDGELVLVCSDWPTVDVVNFLKAELVKQLPLTDDQYEYEVKATPEKGQLVVRVTRKVPESELRADESIADEWPVITVHIQLTSSVVGGQANKGEDPNGTVVSGAVEAAADGSKVTALPTAPEQPQPLNKPNSESVNRGQALFAHGERIPKEICLQALDAIDQAKWFQAALMNPPLGLVARVLVDFMHANKVWLNLNQFGVLALLSRLLTLDSQLNCVASVRSPRPPYRRGMPPQSPFGTPIRGPMPMAAPPIGPGRLFRRFFEAIASGLLFYLHNGDEAVTSGCTTITEMELKNRETEAQPIFFAYKLLADVPVTIREEVTLSAQFFLRQIAFKQLYKVLRMEPFNPSSAPKNEPGKDIPEINTPDAGAVDSGANEVTPPGAIKRRRSEIDPEDVQQKDLDGDDNCGAVPSDESCSTLESHQKPPDDDSHEAETTTPLELRSGTAAKRSRRGRL